MLENKYVQASGYAARGYAKFVLEKDFAALIADVSQALKILGVSNQQINTILGDFVPA